MKTVIDPSDFNWNKKMLESGFGEVQNLMIFDLEHTGHHAIYIRYLVNYWNSFKPLGNLFLLVTPSFVSEHKEIVIKIENSIPNGVQIQTISSSEEKRLISLGRMQNRVFRRFYEFYLLYKNCASLSIDHCLIMFIDKLQLPLMIGLTPPCKFSGIYFRPTFHYPSFSTQPITVTEQLQHYREKQFLRKLLGIPKFHKLFCIDPLVSGFINHLLKTQKAITLSDPVETCSLDSEEVEKLSQPLGVENGRIVFLLFGDLSPRKGIYKVLESIENLEDEYCKQICILIIGRIDKEEETRITAKISETISNKPLQIVTHYGFVSDEYMRACFYRSDVVLALYQRHVGMSGILLLAAASNKPVLSTDYGLMGELVRHHKLGLVTDSNSADKIAEKIRWIISHQSVDFFDPTLAKELVKTHSAEGFSKVIFDEILCVN